MLLLEALRRATGWALVVIIVVFLFFVSYALLNRTLAKWFPRPLEIATEQSQGLLQDLGEGEAFRLKEIADLALREQDFLRNSLKDADLVKNALRLGADAAWILDEDGKFLLGAANHRIYFLATLQNEIVPIESRFVRSLPSGAEVWQANDQLYLSSKPSRGNSGLFVARSVAPDFLQRYAEIEKQLSEYQQQTASLRTYRNMILLTLGLFTVLVLFSSMWFALFLSKQVTVPIEALAEGDDAILARVNAVAGTLGNLVEHDARLKDILELLEPARIQLQEAVYALRRYGERLELDPQRLREVE